MTDASYQSVFVPVIQKIMDVYRPTAIVLQCGADSLTGDRLGCFNLTLKGHAECVKFVKSFNVPTLVLGGGGYTIRNVARCWAYETSVLLDTPIQDEIPYNDYYEYYAPDFKLHLTPSPTMENANTDSSLDTVRTELLQQLQSLQGAPSVQMQEIPPDFIMKRENADGKADGGAEDDSRASEFMDWVVVGRVVIRQWTESNTKLNFTRMIRIIGVLRMLW